MFTPSQIKTTIRPNPCTAQDAGIYSNAELDQLRNRFLFSKHSDITLHISYSFISSNTPSYDADTPHDNPYNTLHHVHCVIVRRKLVSFFSKSQNDSKEVEE